MHKRVSVFRNLSLSLWLALHVMVESAGHFSLSLSAVGGRGWTLFLIFRHIFSAIFRVSFLHTQHIIWSLSLLSLSPNSPDSLECCWFLRATRTPAFLWELSRGTPSRLSEAGRYLVHLLLYRLHCCTAGVLLCGIGIVVAALRWLLGRPRTALLLFCRPLHIWAFPHARRPS